MTPKEKKTFLKKVMKLECEVDNALGNLSALANFIQPYFDEEIEVSWTTDGATITNDDGEIGFVSNFISEL